MYWNTTYVQNCLAPFSIALMMLIFVLKSILLCLILTEDFVAIFQEMEVKMSGKIKDKFFSFLTWCRVSHCKQIGFFFLRPSFFHFLSPNLHCKTTTKTDFFSDVETERHKVIQCTLKQVEKYKIDYTYSLCFLRLYKKAL